jgi:hypothetical protein
MDDWVVNPSIVVIGMRLGNDQDLETYVQISRGPGH